MEAKVEAKPRTKIKIKRLLPYLAVFQADLHQTLRSWLFRVWVGLFVLGAMGYVLYRFGAYNDAGVVRPAAELMTDLFRWVVLGSVTLIIILTAGCISSERGTMADSVLSRGISRVQYYMGKWHARLVSILGAFVLISAVLIMVCHFLLRDDRLTAPGSAVALASVAALLLVVISCAVCVSAICNNTLLGVAVVWLLLYGASFLLTFLPPMFPSPDRTLRNLPNVLCGYYDLNATYYLLGWCAGISIAMSLVGMICFSRRDI
jgi:putative exporter of polyketide antibiotics